MTPPQPARIRADIRELPATLQTIDLLARLHLDCHRAGYTLILDAASPQLSKLITLCGLPLHTSSACEAPMTSAKRTREENAERHSRGLGDDSQPPRQSEEPCT